MDYKKSILENGIRIITMEMPQMKSVATTIYVKAGSRYETEKINGISHFLEHMLFKGSEKYQAQAEIAKAIEGVGGQINAWTDQDHTAYTDLMPAEFANRGFEVLADMLTNTLLRQSDIDREKGVIIEEINRRNDDPASMVYEILVELMWPNQPLGWTVLGSKKNIMAINREEFLQYMGHLYNSRSMVVSVAGNIKHGDVVKSFEKLFASISQKNTVEFPKATSKQEEPKISIYKKKTDQAHLTLGVRGMAYGDKDRYILMLLNNILGQGMGSRLFLNIREEKGLAYHISSFVECYEDTGSLVVHAGLNIDKLKDAISAICDEFKQLRDISVGSDELRKSKDFVKGTLTLSMDDTENVSSWFGRQELLMPEVLMPEQVIAKIESVTSEDIQRVARRVFQDKNLNLAIIAPIENKDEFRSVLTLD